MTALIARAPLRSGLFRLAVAAVLGVWAPGSSHSAEVVEDFESGANPDGWNWANLADGATIVRDDGNPGAWMDTGAPYFAGHPYLISVPPSGSALQSALASGRLRSASIDIRRFDTTGVTGCQPTHLQASFVSLALFDLHSADLEIQAHTTAAASAAFPAGAFPWRSAGFAIPAADPQTPPGWQLDVPPGIDYTWADLMRNVDGVRFYVGDPDQFAFSACSHLGADNVVIAYEAVEDDIVFRSSFEDGECAGCGGSDTAR